MAARAWLLGWKGRARRGCRGWPSELPLNKLIFANLLHRPLRSIISIFAVAIEVVMILSIVAIFMGMLNDTKERNNGIGADLVVAPSNAAFLNGMSGASMSVKLAPYLATLPHVTVASPVITQTSF